LPDDAGPDDEAEADDHTAACVAWLAGVGKGTVLVAQLPAHTPEVMVAALACGPVLGMFLYHLGFVVVAILPGGRRHRGGA